MMSEKNGTLTEKVKAALRSPRGTLIQIELLASFAAFLLIFLVVVGAYRRRCNNAKFRTVLSIAFVTPPTLVHYTTGLINGAQSNEYYTIWVILLMILNARADSFSALNFGDSEGWKAYNVEMLFTTAVGLLLLISLAYSSSPIKLATVFLYLSAVLKITELAQASMLASRAVLTKNAKLVADYMIEEHANKILDEVDLNSMKGYSYLVRGEEEEQEQYSTLMQRLFMKWCFGRKKVVKAEAPFYHVPMKSSTRITIEDVWQCQGKLLSKRDPDHRIKDFCLSFALFKIFCLRHTDYYVPQEVCDKSWKLFQEIIRVGYERAFRIIEVELTFVFGQFYTKYPYILNPHHWQLKFGEGMLVSISSCLVASNILHNLKQEPEHSLEPEQKSIMVVTSTLTFVVLILEILQLLFIIFSEWGKVVLICNYVKRESWQSCKYLEKLIEFICQTELLKPWERRLHQYSLLESYDYSPSLLLYNNLTAIISTQEKEGQKESAPIELSTEVKEAVIGFLRHEGTKLVTRETILKNGKISLAKNNVEEHLWACDLETQAQVIMVWHIATGICVEKRSKSNKEKEFKIATSLSRYLAYLVVFAPKLLPDHSYITEHVFDQVILEARDTLKNCNGLDDVINELLKDEHHSEESKTVIERGARLGKQLSDAEEINVWQVLADFWVELLLYVAPSESDAHIEKLTSGGEFITHIWILLLHSGIERDLPCNAPWLEKSSGLQRSSSWP